MTLPFDPSRKESRDEDLRRALAWVDDAARPRSDSEFDADAVYRAAAGELPAEERLRLIDRMASDPELAEAWRLAVELQAAARRADPATAPAPVRSLGRREGRWNPAWLALAATLILAIGIGVRHQLVPEPTWRGQRLGSGIELLVADEARLPRNSATLRWRADGALAAARVLLTTPALEPVYQSPEIAVEEFTVPAAALAAVPAGSRLLWRIEARTPEGAPRSSTTGVFVLVD
jgi:hypothetical protein